MNLNELQTLCEDENNLHSFMEEFQQYTEGYMRGVGFAIADKPFIVDLHPRFKKEIYIASIMAENENAGALIRSLMTMITGLADKHQVELVLFPKPFGSKKLNKQQLIRLYGLFGFKRDREGEMRRKPGS